MTADTNNELTHHLVVAIGSIAVAVLLWVVGYGGQRVVGAVPFFVLFVVMVIGPLVRIRPSIRRRFSGNVPVNWRSELGIWFAIWSVIHVLFVFAARDWDVVGYLVDMSPWAFGAMIAVLIAVVLAFTSNDRAYDYLGPKAWKWHQSHGTYVIFWLVAVHGYDRAYLRPYEEMGFPSDDPLHLLYLAMIVVVVVLHVVAFAAVVSEYRESGDYPPDL
ncbi:hypothetical protein [Natronobacterium gregoryi]|uniref:Sulfoxide reductase heme-binding subunit YedZ n=2 Tax=Natronobacterium gregoryi TaxID=44930 RepID=L0ACQ6_NATGS|nr:hypothetical protein [Natronobacterium gregoryi]AFZ71678.1 hypothetical protein Natgr_0423 [Natronobacterium gregoryi SP2]ELY72750.1 hypothetical protein C490_02908 [Natronobacterium gregoryi SP2]PLK20274.1 hypothetical protein CYV19_10610 [Natronobacterium gregoryi SP2]SFJ24853.1 sulfoxide reductase heme-binding subunit YedZ [Natronobacterium gregoryi]